jgi:hypothetical protein
MIIAFVACMDDETDLPIRGNGKTCAMTGYAYLNYREGKKIYTNYKTDFSDYMGLQKMIDTLGNNQPHPDTILCVTEIGKMLNSLGSEVHKAIFVENFVRQLRKLELTLYIDDQRFLNIHKRLRIHVDVIFILEKIHLDGHLCYNDLCKKEHIINVYSEKPFKPKRIRAFYASEVGKHYNTNEYILDDLIVPKRKITDLESDKEE